MKIGHEMILASAGSGKTYALTNRFVRLLALGAKPERIVALTFTRKAAGEFFDQILRKLASAASDEAIAQQLAKGIEVEGMGSAEFLALLRQLVEVMHRLRLGTFDGFFARIARNFPLELGLSGEFEVLQNHAEQVERGRVIRQMFTRSGPISEQQKNFIEAFKLATIGTDEKRPGARLTKFIEQYQDTFLDAQDGELWGNPARIWPQGSSWIEGVKDREIALKSLQAEMVGADLNEKQRNRWDAFFDEAVAWVPGVPMKKGLGYLFGNALKEWPELRILTVERKKQELSEAASAALRKVVRSIVGAELLRRLEMTQGIFSIIDNYESIYHQAVRRAGKLSFADVQRLLLPTESGGRVLSGEGDDERRLLIDFRLDGEIDHWLLDEFQDTSFAQWSVLENLIDEAVQDPSGARSLFYVGDVKQSIYAWRGGDPRLFREIFNRYNAGDGGTISEKHLEQSWRSGPPVIEMVNQVFGDSAVITEMFPGEASQAWNQEWRDHSTAKPERNGQAALLHGYDEAERFAITLNLLQEIQPLEKGLSVAVIVQKNTTAAGLADYLRREGGLPAVAESDLHVCVDNPVGAALLAMVKASAYPGDTLSWEHVKMTPLGGVLQAAGITTPARLTLELVTQLYADGFEETCRRWWRKLETKLAGADAFSRLRARQFLAAASQFDATGSCDVAEFVEFMSRHTVRETDSAAVVRVMTIHKSKGLGFDVVILPDLEGQKLNQARAGLTVRRSADHNVEWVMDMPTKDFANCDEVLAAQMREAESAGCYEKLSLLYVAMTRAKRGLYLVIKPPKKSTSQNFTKLLTETLEEDETEFTVGDQSFAGSFSSGDATWHRQLKPTEEPPQVETIAQCLDPLKVRKSPRLIALRPSDGKSGVLPASMLFALKRGGTAAEFGHRLHALLAEVEWLSAEEIAASRERWAGQGDVGLHALECLEAQEFTELWTRDAGAGVWRERMFEIVLEGTWVTGVFDRVVIDYTPNGKPSHAWVYDFKTDETKDGAVERHSRQLNIYRQAAAQLLGIPLASVSCFLAMTRAPNLLEVPFRN